MTWFGYTAQSVSHFNMALGRCISAGTLRLDVMTGWLFARANAFSAVLAMVMKPSASCESYFSQSSAMENDWMSSHSRLDIKYPLVWLSNRISGRSFRAPLN